MFPEVQRVAKKFNDDQWRQSLFVLLIRYTSEPKRKKIVSFKQNSFDDFNAASSLLPALATVHIVIPQRKMRCLLAIGPNHVKWAVTNTAGDTACGRH